jgi:low temperature requirement protein LtrA
MTLLHKSIRPLRPRDPAEGHRAATPLELLFDLVSVIAIAAAAAGLHHAIAEDHAAGGILRYLLVFFAIWWAWMNFTWYASAYDNDDALHRLLTMVIMGGALLLAAGVDRFFTGLDISLVVAGYVIMRLALCLLWLRAARHDPPRRVTTLRYAAGIALVQAGWVALALLGDPGSGVFPLLMLAGFVAELAVPAFAERASPTPWHRHHIVERYGLLTIIVLGEILLAAAMALEAAWDGSFDIRLVHTALSALVITFAMWWLYFSREDHLQSQQLHHALQWGYGHILVFGAGAAVGAGFAVLVDILAGHSDIPLRDGDLAVGIPLALYLAGLWFVRDRLVLRGAASWILLPFAAAIAFIPFVFPALEVIAALMLAAVAARIALQRGGPAA